MIRSWMYAARAASSISAWEADGRPYCRLARIVS